MFSNLLKKMHRRVFIRPGSSTDSSSPELLFMAGNPRYANYQIGEWTYGFPRVLSGGEGAKLIIGRFCSIADEVTILLGGEHRWDWGTTYPFNVLFPDAAQFLGHPKTKGDVIIGNDVWIGLNALILSGVTIGNGAVVAAHSVVAKDIAPYSIVAGNPARHIKFRFSESIIASLQRIAWWDWPIEEIKKAWPLLLSTNVDDFVMNYGSL